MFVFKKKYYLIIESIKDIELRKIKKKNKIVIIYRNKKSKDKFSELSNFRSICQLKKLNFL